MKKKLIVSTILALVMVLVPSSVAFANGPWDVEDPLVAGNEDCVVSGGFDEGSWEFTAGAQYWAPGVTVPNDGYNLYRDDATDTGNFDAAFVWTFTPDVVDLPITASYGPYPDEGIAEYFMMQDESPDTWYWATEPRGYNLPPPPPAPEPSNRYSGLGGVFWVEVFNYSGFDTFKWNDWSSPDRVLRDPVVATNTVNGVNEVTCTLYIPEGTHLSYPGRPGTLVTNLFIERNDGGGVYFKPSNVDFSQVCTLALVYPDGTEEVVTFTQIRDGLAR